MYESYAWPGAHHNSIEHSLIIKWVKELFDGIIKEIERTEKKV